MLQHQDGDLSQQGPAPPPPAAQRVTPEELTEALAALEARREEEARRLRGTVPIGEAVKELGLDATPEEIWRQVEAQRARQAAPPPAPESRLADAVNETLHAAAQQAHKLAGQASAAAAASLAAAQAQSEARHSRKRRVGGGGFGIVIALAVVGSVWFNSLHGLMIGGDHAARTYAGSHGPVMVTGDHDALTLAGDCGTLTVVGDHDNITITGTVLQINNIGDGNTIRWVREERGQTPSITDLGDDSRIGRAPAEVSPHGAPSIPLPPAVPPLPDVGR